MLRNLASMILLVLLLAGCSRDASGTPDGSASSDSEADLFVEGNLFFIGYHELGHALVFELDIPVTGREEDAVDRLATWLLTPKDDTESPDYLIKSIDGWFRSSDTVNPVDIEWWGEHGTDQQRAYQIACLLYGAKPDSYQDVADDVDLPSERRESCVEEAEQNEKSWSYLLDEFWRQEAQSPETPSARLIYLETEKFAHEKLFLQKIGLLEDIIAVMNEDFTLAPGIVVEASECDGEPNAFWNSEERLLTICYELVADYRKMAQVK